jgi:hypothetical protein
MAIKLYNLARVSTSTTGTGAITLGSAVTGFLTFAASGVSDGEVVYYGIRDGVSSEVGYGTYTSSGTTLTRTVLKSTNSDNAISLSGSAEVFITAPMQAYPVGKQTIYIPAGAMVAATTNGPASAVIESTTNKQNYTVYDFDGSTAEYAHFQIAFPKGWDLSTITYKVRWGSSATDTDGVAWNLQAVAISDGDTIDASWGTAITVTDAAQSSATKLYVTSVSSALTIAGTPAADDLVYFRFYRDPSNGSDTMAEDARLFGIDLYYNINAGNDN